ncbi:rRNA (cytidine-2'-O-)-methyltransferase, partial [Patescibacteria group bacterium]|nr:rRNA (cytidine-2'-O-)-methyltransferase [Patescibacteria group bacterium]
AIIAGLAGSGVDTSKFTFLGFMPHKKGRQTLFEQIKKEEQTVVFYESCHRILKTLEALKDCEKQIVLCRELTKIHEEFLRGTAVELLKILEDNKEKQKGEFVVIVS